jgi:sugar phosphate isomerase/epimerase
MVMGKHYAHAPLAAKSLCVPGYSRRMQRTWLSRRQLGRAAGGLLLAGSRPGAAAPSGRKGHVILGVQSYSLRDRPLDQAMVAMAALGFSTCELWQGHIEPQLAREALRRWRLETPLEDFRAVGARFAAAKVPLCAYNYSFKDDFTDAEIERGFAMAKALGVHVITASANQNVVARVAPLAQKHRIRVGLHNHSKIAPNEFATPEDFDRALSAPGHGWIAVNLDIGHFTAANFDAVAFLRKHGGRITTLHIKDRKRNDGPAVPFGTGDAPIAAVLQWVRDRAATIPANIEYEYQGGGGAVDELKRCRSYCQQVLGEV